MMNRGMNDQDREEGSPDASRRDWLRSAAGVTVAGGLAGPWNWLQHRVSAQEAKPAGAKGPDALLVRSARPLDLETPVEAFDQFLTPNDRFFVRSHFGAPAVELRPWQLNIQGLVGRPITLSLDDLAKFEQVSAPSVLQCS